jgi:hypothetical protein
MSAVDPQLGEARDAGDGIDRDAARREVEARGASDAARASESCPIRPYIRDGF